MSLKLFVEDVFQVKKHGGVMMWRDENTLIISDISKITHEQHCTISSSFPHVHVDILSSDASITGFIVVLHCASNPIQHYYLSYARILLHFLLLIFGIVWYVIHHYHREFTVDEKAST